jgi:predicted metal-dependent phosphoesterase TrpH
MPVDLHVHTTASDGAFAPSEVVAFAIRAGLTALAITDHDSTDGIDEALAAAADSVLTVIPGVELSVDEVGASSVHVLGYLIDHREPRLVAALATLREARDERARVMVEALSGAGYEIDLASVRAIAGAGSIGRVHVAQALVAAGGAPDVGEAFRQLIGRGAPFYFRKRTLSAAEAIATIHGAGGVAVLAHPGVSGSEAFTALLAAGLDGVEAFHAEHDAADCDRFARLAQANGLLVTGGSDFHGPGVHTAPIGGGGCPEDAPEALRRRAAAYRA